MVSFKQFLLEYQHNYGDDTAAQSIKAHNGKGGLGSVALDAKIPYIVGDRQEEIQPGVYQGAKLNEILSKIGATFQAGKVLKNYKTSGNDCIMKIGPAGPMVQIIKGLNNTPTK